MQPQANAKQCPIILIDEEDDDDFLSEIAAVEAKAQSESKRRKLDNSSSSPSQSIDETKVKTEVTEGAYTAALRGGKSLQAFLAQQQQQKTRSSYTSGFNPARSRAAGDSVDGSEPSKACRCGLGICSIFMANTEKNRGRRFYRCPVREENGGCGFFEWCDTSTTAANYTTSAPQTYASKSIASVSPDFPCVCGAGPCLVLTAKTGRNMGRQFYQCPANQENSCSFFEWCTDPTTANVTACPPVRAADISKTGSSSCFKCGKEDHWSRDCPMFSIANSVTKSASSGTCCKCGLAGHWANDCSSDQQIANSGTKSASPSTCYKCGLAGHWARDCSSNQQIANSGTKSASSGTCYKCGLAGHWANECSSNQQTANSGTKSASSGTCYICGLPGHWARDCSSTTQQTKRY